MAKYKTKRELINLKDYEIINYISTLTFRGTFKKEIPAEFKDRFCGQINNISVNGEINELCPRSIFVPTIFKTKLEQGTCEFSCFINIKALRSNPSTIKLIIRKIYNIEITSELSFDVKEENTFKRNLRLKNNLFIGQFTKNKDGSFVFRDIRRNDFSKLVLQNGKEQNPIVYHPEKVQLEDGKYYEFSWVLIGKQDNYEYSFKVDESKPFKVITAHDLVSRLYNDIMDYPPGAGQKIVKMLDTLKTQLTASGKEIFIYELLQNANDYPHIVNGEKEKVDVEFHLTKESLIFMHSGAEFNEKNVAAICSINDKEKTDNKEAIGYKGIGFKTVFLDNNYVYLQTGDFSFRFDKEETKDIVDTPWQILPIWTNYMLLTGTERFVFTNADSKFRVKFALRPTYHETLRGAGQNYVKMFKEVFKNERVILFIPNLASVKIYLNGHTSPDIVCSSDNEHWQVNHYDDPIKKEITDSINADINKQEETGSIKIPTKYYDFTKTRVSFACEVEGDKLNAVSDSQIYCYLPTKASWGFKFLMNTDMIPTGPRNDIEIDFNNQININAEISEIAGLKFFDWIKDLCKCQKFTLCSIFALIPSFKSDPSRPDKYVGLIERFKNGFESRLKTEGLIPVGKNEYVNIKNIILDETGILASGIISDDDFLTATGINGYLPVSELRKSKDFNSFAKRYIKLFKCENNIWTVNNLKEACSSPFFIQWLSNQDNNNHFIDFLLSKDLLKEFINAKIFIEDYSGQLHTASELYFNIDEHLIDLKAFEELLPHLSVATRNYFSSNDCFNKNIENNFKIFNPDSFVKKVLLNSSNYDETLQKLRIKVTSLAFYRFLAKNSISFKEDNYSLPFFNDEDKCIEGFNIKLLFLDSQSGKEISRYKWLNSASFVFVSSDYDDFVKSYLKTNFHVRDFSDMIVMNEVILSEDYHNSVETSIKQSFETAKHFVNYCFDHKNLLENNNLSNYSLHVLTSEENDQWQKTSNHIYFHTPFYDEKAKKQWLSSGWMFALDDAYMVDRESDTEFKVFLMTIFGVAELDESIFYLDVVKANLSSIIDNTSGDNDLDKTKNYDFIKYLDSNFKLIFEEENDKNIFSKLVLISKEGLNISANSNKLYLYDPKLVDVTSNSWFPNNTVNICSPQYGQSPTLIAIGAQVYKFETFFADVISSILESINKKITDKKTSIEFHNFIIKHSRSIPAEQLEKMRNAKVFLYGHNEPASSASGHRILTKESRELLEMELMDFSLLDIIDPDYHTEENNEYWATRLANTELTAKKFFILIKEDSNALIEITKNLNDKEKSIKFYQILADNKIFENTFLNFPLFNDSDIIINDFKNKIIFFASKKGHEVCGVSWLSSVPIEFISPDYLEETRIYFKENYGVLDFSDEIVVKNIIMNHDLHDVIVKKISDSIESSKAFVDYCYANKQSIEASALSKYPLHVFDKSGVGQWCTYEEEVFFPSNTFDDYSMLLWLNDDSMYSLDIDYFEEKVDKDDFKRFLIHQFGVSDIDDKKFYKYVVKKNIKSILSNINKENDPEGAKNYNFISYLDSNYQLIFTEGKDSNLFEALTLRTFEGKEVNALDGDVYIYDDEIVAIISNLWFPKDKINLCSPNYGKSKALSAIGVKSFKFGTFYDDTIVANLDEINKKVENKEQSIAFHNFIISNAGSLTDNQKAMMKGAKVYLYGHNEASPISNGHQTLSANARELFSKGLVEISDLDIIDPDYHTDLNSTTRNYWEVQLKNTKFTVNHFFIWLKDNFDVFSKTVEDERKNIDFWRWLFSNNISDGLIKEAIGLPVLLKNGTTMASNALVYFSDDYLGNTVIESTLTLYDKGASILSPKYIEEGDNIDLWKIFWNKVGIKYEILNILTDTIIPTLSIIKGEYLPKLIADHRESLEKYYEQKLISHLTNLQVKAHDGNFYTLRETVYIDCYDKEEPFPYIVLPNQIAYSTPEERRLIKDIIEEVKGTIVTTLTQWQQLKIDHYLKVQYNDAESIKEYHYCFINDLSSIRNKEQEALKVFNHIDEIRLLDRDNKLCKADTLTMGSVYKPYFDFEHCGVTTTYVSDTYSSECSEYVGKLFRKLGVKYDLLKEEDLKYLTQRTCAIYYWKEYLTNKNHFDSRVAYAKNFIKSHRLDNLSCIPTKDFMKTPRELYYGSEVAKLVKNIEDWENKTPLTDLPKIKLDDDSTLFSLLPFKESLDFLDALYALTQTNSQDKRIRLLRWMIDSYEESFKSKIEEYRDDKLATWNNNQNECVQIKHLYALAYGENKLEQYFGTNPRIVNKAFFPGGESFKKACDILGIKIITTNDLKMEPDGDSEYHDNDIVHKIYALVIAGKVDIDNWKDLYKHYCECLSKLVLHKCNSIKISYKNDPTISEPLFKFYHEDGANDFYFVDSLDNKHVFAPYVSEFKLFLEIGNYGKEGKKDIQLALLQDIMDSKERAIQIVNEQNSLKLDQDFVTELAKLAPETAGNIQGRGIAEEPEEGYGTPGFNSNPDASEKPDAGHGNEPHKVGNIILALDEDELDCWQDYETDNLEAPTHPDYQIPISEEFVSYTQEFVEEDDVRIEVVCEHYRCGTWVRGHWRSGYWVNGYWRNGSNVSPYLRTNKPGGNTQPVGATSGPSTDAPQTPASGNTQPGGATSGPSTGRPQIPTNGNTQPGGATSGTSTGRPQIPTNGNTQSGGATSGTSTGRPQIPTNGNTRPGDATSGPSTSRPQTPASGYKGNGVTPSGTSSSGGIRRGPEFVGTTWRPRTPWQPTPEEIEKMRPKGIIRTLEVLEPSKAEIEEINRILGDNLTAEEIADHNYLAQLRLYNNLAEKGFIPDESKDFFIRNSNEQYEHSLFGGKKYIHKCSAAGGIMYLSPSIWNKIADEQCIVCVYLGAKANEFMYFYSIDDILKWVGEDDILIKLTGPEKVKVVEKLYSEILKGVTGTAYTMIRIFSSERTNSLFAPLNKGDINEPEEKGDEYDD